MFRISKERSWLNLSVLGFSFVVFHDKAKRTQHGNLLQRTQHKVLQVWPVPAYSRASSLLSKGEPFIVYRKNPNHFAPTTTRRWEGRDCGRKFCERNWKLNYTVKQVVQLGTENVSVSESGVGWMQVMQDKLHLGQMMPGLPEPGDAGTSMNN